MTGKKKLITIVVNQLKKIEEIKAIVLAGSYATQTHRQDSDIDFGIFYSKKIPLNIDKINSVAKSLDANLNAIVCKIDE